jgi:hypothetical protein
MSKMVERVAKALWQHFATEGTFDEDRHNDREAYLLAARAVIAVIRDPTIAMEEAGAKGSGEDSIGVARGVWKAMIDEALKCPSARIKGP